MAGSKFTSLVPCKKCGTYEKYGSGNCVACQKESALAWKKKNHDKVKSKRAEDYKKSKEKELARSALWREKNPERVKTVNKAYRDKHHAEVTAAKRLWQKENPACSSIASARRYAENPRKHINRNLAWRAANPDAVKISEQNRRARQKGSGGKISTGLSLKLFKLQQGKCPCCNDPLGDDYHMDHIIPIALGGANVDENIQLLRAKCNMQKNAKHPVDFMQSRGFLL